MSTPLARSFSLGTVVPRLHHLDGAPVRAAICEQSLFVAAHPGPASAPIHSLIDKRLWSLPSVYALLWDAKGGQREIYVGSTKDPLERLMTHDRANWAHAVLLTGHGLTRGAALQME